MANPVLQRSLKEGGATVLPLAFLAFLAPCACGQDGDASAERQLAPSEVVEQYWPHWRGPNRDGIAAEAGWALSSDGPRWSADLGLGYSAVSIADGRLFTQGHDPDAGEDTIFCFDPVTGEELWTHTFAAPTMKMAHTGGSLCTPSIDGDKVYVSSRIGLMFCFDAASGEIVWQQDLKEEYDLQIPTWGFAASPLVLDDMIVMNMGKVIALDRGGKEIWKTKDYGHAYATPELFEFGGKPHLAVFSGKGLVVLDQKSGAERAVSEWKTSYDVNAATPVVIGDRIFISSGYNTGCSMLRFDGKSLETLWTNKEMRNHMSGCVLFEDHLFGVDENLLKCLDLDGNVKWSQRGLGKGAILLADGKILMLSARGQLVVAEASTEEYVELARQDVFERGGRQWTTPVLAGGLIYCRNSQGKLVCLDHRAEKGAGEEPAADAAADKGDGGF